MKRFSKFTMSVLCAQFCASAALAQAPVVRGTIKPDSVMIGDRIEYAIEVEKDQVQVVSFPEFENSDRSPLECLQSFPVDTIRRDGRKIVLRKRYVLTAFDGGDYSLGRAKVLYADKNITDTIYGGDSLRVNVKTFQIDSTSHAIFDIKPQRTLKFRLSEITGYIKWGIIALLIVAAAIWLLQRWLEKRGKRLSDLFKAAPPQPPHVVAIAALEALAAKKLWQNDKHKQYYSELTDILRTYLVGRYGVGAMEMTSDEIMDSLRDKDIPTKCSADIRTVLSAADLVKFAKHTPESEENDDNYTRVYYFVEETKPVEVQPDEEEDQPVNRAKRKKTKK